MGKMRFETADGALKNMEKFVGLFPQAVTEVRGEDGMVKRAIKWDVLKERLLGEFGNGGDQIACFDANVPEPVIREIAKCKPLRAVFRDASFSSTPEKINVEEIFKLLSPTTTVKVI